MTPKPTNNGCEPFNQKFTRRAEKERWNLPTTKYEPLNVLRDLPQPVLRPGALDHTKYGSRQPDGSTRPYAVAGAPRFNIKRSFQFLDK